MIAACPSCSARYRIEPERLGVDGVRLRCSRCESVFRVRPPAAPAEPHGDSAVAGVTHSGPARAVASPMPAARNEPVASDAEAGQPQGGGDLPATEGSRLVLIADPEIEAGKATAHAVASWGLDPVLVHDGVEAIMSIQRMLPRVVVMDAALPKMFGFQVCEVLKRNESLRDIHVVLVGAIHRHERYRRPPTELYGADSYVERPELVEKLRGILEGIGMPTSDVSGQVPATPPSGSEPRPAIKPQPSVAPQTASAPEPAPAAPDPAPAAPEPAPVAPEPTPNAPRPAPMAPDPAIAPVAPALPERNVAPSASPVSIEPKQQERSASSPTVAPAGPDAGVAAAERLARIVVSDIVLYNQEKFDNGVRDGNVLESMASDLAEGRSLFDGRVAPAVRAERDFLAERLLEVARERGMS